MDAAIARQNGGCVIVANPCGNYCSGTSIANSAHDFRANSPA